MSKPNARLQTLHPSAYGGVLRNRARGRGARSISTLHSMHIVLRSSLAKGYFSFVRPENRHFIKRTIYKQARRFSVEIIGIGNAGNHIHLRLKVSHRDHYMSFIRAITGEIALKIKNNARTIATKLKDISQLKNSQISMVINNRFWDHRPFSSIVSNFKYGSHLTNYLKINELEGYGYSRAFARLRIENRLDPTTS